jgi:energy-coupling factor transporter ATP-binding protein EcfA2
MTASRHKHPSSFSFKQWFRAYLWGIRKPFNATEEVLHEEDIYESALHMTGDSLVHRVSEAIKNRQSVLLTGPRGCGKSYCAEQGIRLAREEEQIGGWRFLQGNREIPRDLLSEDMLIIGESGKPELLKALALRPFQPKKVPEPLKALQSRWTTLEEDWPAVPSQHIYPDIDPRHYWTNLDWQVLYLDEINRFGDGFLDSLLSLTEEGKIVRRGEDYYIPMLLVATANPPGYDITAKRLSPPLQARISCSYRVSQPSLEVLAQSIVPTKLQKLHQQYPKRFHVPEKLAYLAAAITLCLWGNPDADSKTSASKGIKYLSQDTRKQLRYVMTLDRKLRIAMNTLSRLILFGPDSRAVGDWLASALGLCAHQQVPFSEEHLQKTALEVLGHKVRENFNEGAEPGKIALKEQCIADITACVLSNEEIQKFFWIQQSKKILYEKEFEPEFYQQLQQSPVLYHFQEPLFLLASQPHYQSILFHKEALSHWIKILSRILEPQHISDTAKDKVLWEGFYQLITFQEKQKKNISILNEPEEVGSLLKKSFQVIKKVSNAVGIRRCHNTLQRLELLLSLDFNQASQSFLPVLKPSLPLKHLLLQHSQKFLQDLTSLSNHPTERLYLWLQVLMELRQSPPSEHDFLEEWKTQFLALASQKNLLTPYKRFTNHIEHQWFQDLFQSAKAFVEKQEEQEFLTQLSSFIQERGCSAQSVLETAFTEYNESCIPRSTLQPLYLALLEDPSESSAHSYEKNIFGSFCQPHPLGIRFLQEFFSSVLEPILKGQPALKEFSNLLDSFASDFEKEGAGEYLKNLSEFASLTIRLLSQVNALFEQEEMWRSPSSSCAELLQNLALLDSLMAYAGSLKISVLENLKKYFVLEDVRSLYRNLYSLISCLSDFSLAPEKQAWRVFQGLENMGERQPKNFKDFVSCFEKGSDAFVHGKFKSKEEKEWLASLFSQSELLFRTFLLKYCPQETVPFSRFIQHIEVDHEYQKSEKIKYDFFKNILLTPDEKALCGTQRKEILQDCLDFIDALLYGESIAERERGMRMILDKIAILERLQPLLEKKILLHDEEKAQRLEQLKALQVARPELLLEKIQHYQSASWFSRARSKAEFEEIFQQETAPYYPLLYRLHQNGIENPRLLLIRALQALQVSLPLSQKVQKTLDQLIKNVSDS